MSLRADDVSLRLGGQVVLDAVTVQVSAGEVHALVGPNGAGKSTLLKVMSGEERPDEGHAGVDGKALHRLEPLELARQRSVMAQSGAVAFDYFVEEVLAMGWLGASCGPPRNRPWRPAR